MKDDLVERLLATGGRGQGGQLKKEAADAIRALQAALRNDRNELHRLMKTVPGAHFCQDWDGLLVWPGTPEAECCTCRALALSTGQEGGR